MLKLVLWALSTGFVTGAVWFAIVFLRRDPDAVAEPPVLPEPDPTDSLALEEMHRRLLEVEARLDASEHLRMRANIEQPRKRSD